MTGSSSGDPAAASLAQERLRAFAGVGLPLGDGFISPLDLVAVGLTSTKEADELHAVEAGAAGARQ